jgi:hypothetical protein
MKMHLIYLGILAFALNACGPAYVVQRPAPPPPAPAEPPPADDADVSYQTFYDQLSPYGQWVEDPEYGYVWMPEVTADFKPYATNGHWIYTDEGWTWDSGYPWGWAAFHYGRWFFKDGYGWMWIPGNEWAPAWVSWRNSDDYYGWAPLGPSVSLSVAYDGGYNPPAHYWCFVPHQYVSSPQVSNYYVRETNNVTIINRTTIINTTVINNTAVNNRARNGRFGYGPDPNEVGRYTGSPLHPVPIRDGRTPGGQAGGGSFTVYRPHVNAPPAGDTHPGNNGRPVYAPTHFQTLNNARPVNRTSYGNAGSSNGGNSEAGNNGGNNGNRNGDNGNRNGGNNQPPAGNNGNRNGWNNQPANSQPVNNQPANTPPATTTPASPAPGNAPGNRPTNFPGAPSGQVNQPNSGRPGRGFQPGQAANQPANQAANQAVNQPANQPASQPAGRPAGQPGGRNSAQSSGQPTGRSNGQSYGQQPATPVRQQQGHSNAQPSNPNQPRPVASGPKPAPDQQRPPHPPGKPETKPDNKP